jgi:hypothetical protein
MVVSERDQIGGLPITRPGQLPEGVVTEAIGSSNQPVSKMAWGPTI